MLPASRGVSREIARPIEANANSAPLAASPPPKLLWMDSRLRKIPVKEISSECDLQSASPESCDFRNVWRRDRRRICFVCIKDNPIKILSSMISHDNFFSGLIRTRNIRRQHVYVLVRFSAKCYSNFMSALRKREQTVAASGSIPFPGRGAQFYDSDEMEGPGYS